MQIYVPGDKIALQNTTLGDLSQIVSFERDNSQFIHCYSQEKHQALLDDPDCLHLSIRKKDNDSPVGHLINFGLQNRNKSLELKRIVVHEKGQGYGREALQLLKKICFEELKFHRLWLDVFDDNERAIHVYKSEGFVREGRLRECIEDRGSYRSLIVFSMLELEYK